MASFAHQRLTQHGRWPAQLRQPNHFHFVTQLNMRHGLRNETKPVRAVVKIVFPALATHELADHFDVLKRAGTQIEPQQVGY